MIWELCKSTCNLQYFFLMHSLKKWFSLNACVLLTCILSHIYTWLHIPYWFSIAYAALFTRQMVAQTHIFIKAMLCRIKINVLLIQKDTCTPMFIAVLFTIAKTWKQPKCTSTQEWIKKMWYLHIMEYYSAIKNNEIMPFAAIWMDCHTEWNKSDR